LMPACVVVEMLAVAVAAGRGGHAAAMVT
jgi:hypothetical protein